MFKLGSDPEVFLSDKTGKIISAIGKIGGSKLHPLKTENGSVQEDNVLLEFNSVPSSNVEDFVKNHLAVMKDINQIVKPLDLQVTILASARLQESELQHERAKKAGCEPDYDAWKMRKNVPPDLSATNLRSGAGHIHISMDSFGDARSREEVKKRVNLVKACDVCAAIPSVLMDNDLTRRQLYGKAGCHRPKFKARKDAFNGVEYRTLSNFWLASRETLEWAFKSIEMAIYRCEEINERLDVGDIDKEEVQRIINESDKEAALDMCHSLDLLYLN